MIHELLTVVSIALNCEADVFGVIKSGGCGLCRNHTAAELLSVGRQTPAQIGSGDSVAYSHTRQAVDFGKRTDHDDARIVEGLIKERNIAGVGTDEMMISLVD